MNLLSQEKFPFLREKPRRGKGLKKAGVGRVSFAKASEHFFYSAWMPSSQRTASLR